MTRIAVINDEADMVDLLSEALRLRGWDVLEFIGSDGVFQRLMQKPPDLAIVDIRMEARDSGWQLIQKLRLGAATQSMPIIVCSAARQELQDKATWLHERDILTLEKPFDLDDLYQLVERQLNRRRFPHVEPVTEK